MSPTQPQNEPPLGATPKRPAPELVQSFVTTALAPPGVRERFSECIKADVSGLYF